MATKWRPLLLVGLVVGALIALGVRKWIAEHSTASHLEIAQVGDFFLYAPLYVALDAGFFTRQGLDVSIVTTGGDDKTWAAVMSGNAQFGVGDPTFVVASTQRGQPGKIVGSVVNGVPFWGVTWRSDLQPISNGAELQHLRVATFPAPSTAYALQERMFKDAGVSPNISQGAFGSLLTMLRAGQADVALELEPNVSQAVADGAKVLYSMKDIYGDFAITGLAATPDWIEKNPAIVAATACALQQALDLIRKDQPRALGILEKRFSDLRPEVAAAALSRVTRDGIVPSTLVVSEQAWKKAVDLRVSVGDFHTPSDLSAFVDNRFANRAAELCRMQ
jgi:NitT/TauT family transport system substrate-binding protein